MQVGAVLAEGERAVQHATVRASDATFHFVEAGEGPPLLLLHGWPELWLTWEPVMARLAGLFFFDFVYPGIGARKGAPDQLGETFADLDLAMFPGVGHFPHREAPARAADEIAGFFERIGWGAGAW